VPGGKILVKEPITKLDPSPLNVTAVCISRNQEHWTIPEIDFYCYTDGWRPFGHEVSNERVNYLATRRNKAVSGALTSFPETEHILMIDSYYLHQTSEVIKLVSHYEQIASTSGFRDCIVGASTWIFDATRVRPRTRFFDGWTTPEAMSIDLDYAKAKGGLLPVRAVGACYIYPRAVWERVGYDVPIDLHGCEHNWLCEHSGLPVRLSLDEMLWRDPIVYSWPKRIRMSLHLGRFVSRDGRRDVGTGVHEV
jgi:hypothetical protein